MHGIFKAFTVSVLPGLAAMILLLFFSAMISGSEVAFFSLNPAQLKDIQETSSRKNRLILYLLNRPKRLLATILISNNFINVAIVVLSVFITSEILDLISYPLLAFLIQVIIVTAMILLFGEIVPKMYAATRAIHFARAMASPLNIIIKVFYPLSSVLIRSTSFIDKRLAGTGPDISISDLSDAIEITSDESTPEDEKKILKGIVKFGDIEVCEIMKSRVDVEAVEMNDGFDEIMTKIIRSGFSRIPVYEESFDKIQGILYVKDLLPHLDEKEDFKWNALIRDAFFVPENKKISVLLKEFQEKKIHMAIIVDEYGGTSGLVTLEDIIEEIVGDITDEFDSHEDEVDYTRIDEHNFIFEGKTTINDFCKIINIEDEIFDRVKGDSDSLAGLILELEGKIPKRNACISYLNFDFTILEADDRRIQRIKVSIKPDEHHD
ncbi:MAG: gliding motility-associated protein GldE [Bacteroidota bacterium]|nr:gliding motility-associated protein GldE [Bacteroidota bacterium]